METIEQLKEQIKRLQNEQGLMVKTGRIIFINDKVSPKENFSKIDVGIDCSCIIQGRAFPEFNGFQIANFNKDLFKKFDVKDKTNEFNVGDLVVVKLECMARSASTDKNGLDVVYNNVSLVAVKLLEKAEPVKIAGQEPSATQNPEEPAQVDEFFGTASEPAKDPKDDLPF